MIVCIAGGAGAGVDMMAGSNTDDWGLFVVAARGCHRMRYLAALAARMSKALRFTT